MHREARIANWVLAALSIISLTLLSLPLSGPVQTFKACLSFVLDPVAYYGDKGVERLASLPANVRGLAAADVENRQLKDQLKQAALIESQADALKSENERLRSELGLKASAVRQPVWAHVMQRDPLNWYRSFMIDAGSDEGISVNAPVLGQRGGGVAVIGRTFDVRARSSVVLLLTDERSSVAAYVSSASTQPARAYEGLLQGQGSERLHMNYLEPDVKVDTGDFVYTSPTSATFPPGLLIGKVSAVLEPFLSFQAVEVEPALEASSLDEVIVLKTLASAKPVIPAAKPEEPGTQTEAEPAADNP